MKILLVGEYSGFYKNLKEALLELGNEVVLVADGDGWKKISGADYPIYSTSNNNKEVLNCINNFKGYDIVQIINPCILKRCINQIAFRILKKNNKNITMSSAGDDFIVFDAYLKKKYRYFVYDNNPELWKKYSTKKICGILSKIDDYTIAKSVDAIIPTSYEYAEAYRRFDNIKDAIPLPINTEKVKYSENLVRNNKICFFHGINRAVSKGSNYIIEAMKTIEEKYPNDVEIIIRERLPLNEYLSLMSKTNVVLDQCKGYGKGMNALYAMALGKIVMGGNEPEEALELKTPTPPVFNIVPNKKQIEKQMEIILENRREVEKLGYESRQFVEKYHNYIKIGNAYLNEWKMLKSGRK